MPTVAEDVEPLELRHRGWDPQWDSYFFLRKYKSLLYGELAGWTQMSHLFFSPMESKAS